jgi:predicted ATPase
MVAGQLVTGCPRVAVVSTSREPLRIVGEQVYRVPSLSLPDGDGGDLERVADSEAVRLFAERAHQQRPGFALDADNCTAVARLCHRLDGIPLALELAAARVRAMAVGEIERRLDRRFAFLTGGNRDVLPRQQTLAALIDWSYDLLSPGEQDLLERLSAFAGGFDLDGAEQVTGHGLDEVVALVDKSLVQSDDSNNRYRLLESVRDYAAAKLLARGQAVDSAARMAHRDYYLALAEAAAPHLMGHGQIEWLDRLHLEVDNLRAAIDTSLHDPDPEPGLRFARALRYFWMHREPTAEGAIAVCAALDRPDARAPTLERGRAVIAGALLLMTVAPDLDAAAARAEEALAIAHALGDEPLRVEALCAQATVNAYQGNEDALLAIAADGLPAARRLGDPQLSSWLLGQWATARSLSHDERVRAYEESLSLLREVGNQVFYLRELSRLGYLEMEAGQFGAARDRLSEALRVARTIGDRRGLSIYTCNLGFLAHLDGDDTGARTMFDESLQIARRNGDILTIAHAQLGRALLASRGGDARTAACLHGSADAIHERLGTIAVGLEARLREADLARLRETLGDAAFETAYCQAQMTPQRP